MINKKFMFVILMLLSISCVNATEISISNPICLAKWVAPEGFISPDPNQYENVIAVGWNNNISIYTYPYGIAGGTITDVLIGASGTTIDDMVFTPDYIFIVLNNGQVYRIDHLFGTINWNEDITIGENAFLITTVATTTATHHMAIDGSGFVYVTGGKYIYKINPETLTTSASIEANGNLYSLSIGTDGMYTGTSITTTSTTARNYYKWSSLTSYSTVSYTCTNDYNSQSISRQLLSVVPLANDDFLYIPYQYYATTTRSDFSVEYGNISIFITQLDDFQDTTSNQLKEAVVLNNGIGFFVDPVSDKMYTYDVGISGIDFSGGAYVPSKLEYTNTDVYTDYQNYYNGSTVAMHYLIEYDTILQSPVYVSHDYIKNRFNWKLELINPDGVLINSYTIPENFDRPSLLSTSYFIASAVSMANVNPNGTYNIHLFEIDTQTNEKALLDTTSFDVLYATGSGTGSVGNVVTDPENIATDIIGSVYFQAFLLILTCALAGGAVAKGAGFAGGGAIGTVGCAMFGLIPYSFAFIIAVICIAIIASGATGKIGGD